MNLGNINPDFLSPTEDLAGSSETNFVGFYLDESGSTNLNSGDGISIHEKGKQSILWLCRRLSTSTMADSYVISCATFNHVVTPVIQAENWVSPSHVLDIPSKISGGTDIAKVLEYSMSELDAVHKANEVALASVYLVTDGRSDPQKTKEAATKLKAHKCTPSLAVIALGAEADSATLMEIASAPSDRQKIALQSSGVLSQMENPDKLFLRCHLNDGTIPEWLVECARNFLLVLSSTV